MMTISEIKDPDFRNAVTALYAGNREELNLILKKHPGLACMRYINGESGYFKDPYLLWFVADNPILYPQLPSNIASIASLIIDTVRLQSNKSLKEQVDYTLRLVISGRIAYECDVQQILIDVLLEAGADPNQLVTALAHQRIEAAEYLVLNGATLNLPMAVSSGRKQESVELIQVASKDEIQLSLIIAAFFGKADMLGLLLSAGADPNAFISDGSFHSHGNALHQAVYAGSMESVRILVESGADLSLRDTIHGGTPLEWAEHLQRGDDNNSNYKAIETYLAACKP